ncbi:MAG: RibD family protein [Candidatus Heimdallarchaeota archaeon]|nr:RibD family protein [Candidatus Heimdallarchaeota archaeon]
MSRPKVIFSVAASLDGLIATVDGDVSLSNSKDWSRVHHLRANCDAIMVGSGTILSDNSKLTLKHEYFEKGGAQKDPIRIVVTSTGNIPLNANVIVHKPEVPTFIATTSECPIDQKTRFEELGCKVIECGHGPKVNLNDLLRKLKIDFNIQTLMVEGGSLLSGALLSEHLIDEIHISIAPVIGGIGKPLFSLPLPFPKFKQSPFFEVVAHETIGDMIFVRLLIHYRPRQIT